MRAFIAGLFSYMPWWLKALYGVRWAFVRLLGMKQEGVPIVDYRHWTGPVYFNVIRPFHHLVVAAMLRSAANLPADYQPV